MPARRLAVTSLAAILIVRPLCAGAAYHETILAQFGGQPDATSPSTGVVADAGGALYGVTPDGGSYGYGAVFKLTPSASGYTEQVIYSFSGTSDGNAPGGPLLIDGNGAIFGTTAGSSYPVAECGTVYRLTPVAGGTYREKTLHAFPCTGYDGMSPAGGVIRAGGATLYGVTFAGGKYGGGAAFQLVPKGTTYIESIVHSFSYFAEGEWPKAGLVADPGGALFGTLSNGGAGLYGAAFKLTRTASGFTESTMVSFSGHRNGGNPQTPLTPDAKGDLFGTASGGDGEGIVYEMIPAASAYVERVVYRFNRRGGADMPSSGVLLDAHGDLFGTTSFGGPHNWGSVYELSPQTRGYALTILYDFSALKGGKAPAGSLIADATGALYGTAPATSLSQNGVVYKVAR